MEVYAAVFAGLVSGALSPHGAVALLILARVGGFKAD